MAQSEPELVADPRTVRGWINACVVLFFLLLIPIMSHAGGLGMAPLVAIIGGAGWLCVCLTNGAFKSFNIAPHLLALFVFLGWVSLTSLWSPYVTDDALTNPVKLFIGVLLFLGSIRAVRAAQPYFPDVLAHIFIAINLLACGFIIFDNLSNYGLTFLFDPLGGDEDIIKKLASSEMNIGHSVTVLILFLSPLVAFVTQRFKRGKLLALLYIAMLLWAAKLSGLAVGMLSIFIMLIVLIAGKYKPIWMLKTAIGFAICSILFSPLIGVFCEALPDNFKEDLPLSWQHRTAMWEHISHRIWEAPLWGHGFDAVRTFDATMQLGRAQAWPIVSLHPHNAGLHIWVETGLIGALLACTVIYMLGRRLILAAIEPQTVSVYSSFIIAVALISAVTYGVWQDWWWACVIFTAAMLNLKQK